MVRDLESLQWSFFGFVWKPSRNHQTTDSTMHIGRVDAGRQSRIDPHGDHLPQASPMPTQELSDGRRIASGGRDRVVPIHDVGARAEVIALAHAEDVVSVAWSPDGGALASVSDDGVVKVWDARPRD